MPETPRPAACGRIDPATGKPCPIVVTRPVISADLVRAIDAAYGPRACPAHATDNDKIFYRVLDTVWDQGYLVGLHLGETRGVAIGRAETRTPVEVTGPNRNIDDRGRQLVVVEIDGRQYTYHWADPQGQGPLQVGDTVLLPGNVAQPEVHPGVVTHIGSQYTGETRAVLGLRNRP